MIGNWWQYKMDADVRRRELYRTVERERLARQYPGPASLVVDHWMMELGAGVGGLALGALLLMKLL